MSLPHLRTRYRNALNATESVQTFDADPPGPVHAVTPHPGRAAGHYEICNDVVVPGFFTSMRNGQIINNSYYKRSYDLTYGNIAGAVNSKLPGSLAYHWRDVGQFGAVRDHELVPDNQFQLYRNIPNGCDFIVDAEPVRKLAAIKARGNISPALVMGLVSIYETEKTISLITETATRLAKFRKGLVSGSMNLSKAHKYLGGNFQLASVRKDVVDPLMRDWLAYRYGWTPLMYDVLGTLKALDKTRNLKQRARSAGKESRSKYTADYRLQIDDIALEHAGWLISHNETVSARAYCLYEAKLSSQSVRDFGLLDLPQFFWEITPFSFVVDWFIPIGNWLQALTPQLGINIIAEGVTTIRQINRIRVLQDYWWDPHFSLYFDATGYINLTDAFSQKIVERKPSLSDNLLLPPIDVKINVKRALDAIALLGRTSKTAPNTRHPIR